MPGQEKLTEFETDCWFHIEDLMSNFLKKRIVISVGACLGRGGWRGRVLGRAGG
jgi:hypothetical protein